MKSKLRKIGTLLMSLLIISSPLSTYASSNNDDALVDVVISETSDKLIIAQVPKDNLDEFNENLKDDNFKQNQIDSLNLNARALPSGKIIRQKHLYRSDIKAAADRISYNYLERAIASYGVPTAAVGVVKLLGATNFITATAGIIAWTVDDLRIKQDSWWKQAYIDIINRKIRCVRVSHIQNLKPTYPAAWLIIEKL